MRFGEHGLWGVDSTATCISRPRRTVASLEGPSLHGEGSSARPMTRAVHSLLVEVEADSEFPVRASGRRRAGGHSARPYGDLEPGGTTRLSGGALAASHRTPSHDDWADSETITTSATTSSCPLLLSAPSRFLYHAAIYG